MSSSVFEFQESVNIVINSLWQDVWLLVIYSMACSNKSLCERGKREKEE